MLAEGFSAPLPKELLHSRELEDLKEEEVEDPQPPSLIRVVVALADIRVAVADLSIVEGCLIINPVATHLHMRAVADISSVEEFLLSNPVPQDLNLVEGAGVVVLQVGAAVARPLVRQFPSCTKLPRLHTKPPIPVSLPHLGNQQKFHPKQVPHQRPLLRWHKNFSSFPSRQRRLLRRQFSLWFLPLGQASLFDFHFALVRVILGRSA